MILNMVSGSSTDVQVMNVTLDNDVSWPSHWTINNVQLPGGLVNGLVLFLSGSSNFTLTDPQILCMYTKDREQAEAGRFSTIYYTVNSQSTPLITRMDPSSSLTIQLFTYDPNAQTLEIAPNLYQFHLLKGTYTLMIW